MKRRGKNMAVKLRLTRMGAKKRPTYRIVASDSHTKKRWSVYRISWYLQSNCKMRQKLMKKLL